MSGDAVKFLLQTQRIKPPWTTHLNTPHKLTAKRASNHTLTLFQPHTHTIEPPRSA